MQCLHGTYGVYSIYQEKLLLSIFPDDVARAVQDDLYSDKKCDDHSQFRKLYISRFKNVR